MIALFALSAVANVADVDAARPAPSLASLRWHDRVVLLFAAREDPLLLRQRQSFANAATALAERDVRPVEVIGDTVHGLSDRAAALRRRFGVPHDADRMILIGKDGGVKLDTAPPRAIGDLLATIDAMPMRRDEARRR